MLQGAIIGAIAGVVIFLIQTARKKKMAQGESLDSNIKEETKEETKEEKKD